ncbi:MAG TPA: PD-(D/E)XK nuclease family protein [Ilumatobacteraceae bacterium]|nr:PD-(D/E)XK nuclease family protein [Ilumatobacteraceae bacterium]HRB02878.1 PD-(D/E)XK nuclease family protein [Ilumatobacteraceae bacterium]
MALHRLTTPYGPSAFRALREAVDRVQGGDPLAAVTVVVHSNAVGVAARRWLAANGGIAAAQFVTAFRFAELLGGQELAQSGKRPVSTPVVDVAVRQVLEASAGIFQPIAHHQATITALRNTYRDLRHVPGPLRHRLAMHGSVRGSEVTRLCGDVHAVLAGQWYDEADLLHAACGAVGAAPGRTVVFLPQRLRASEQALFDALAAHGEVVLLEGEHRIPDGVPLEVVDASDADEEAREAVRCVVAAVHDGTPLHRIGIVWPRNDPYARLVGEHLHAAGIPWNGRPGIAIHERLAARLVLDLLRLDRRGIRRADLFALLAHVPARLADGSVAPRQRWERVARDAGLAGDADWNDRLSAYSARTRERGVALGNERDIADADAAMSLQAFVADLRGRLGTPDQQLPWQHWADLAHHFLDRWLGRERGIQALPPEEREAFEAVQASLDRLGRLDALAQPVTRTVFAHTLESELESAPGRVGRIGVGVHVGPLSFAVGQPFDLLVVVGACEGLLPAPPPPEALLGDGDRALTDGALPVNTDLAADQQRQLWAALAGSERAVLLSPRGDLRATALRQQSRWVAELALTSPTQTRSVPSFAAGLADAAFPATLSQHRIRALAHASRAGQTLAQHPLAQQLEPLRLGAVMMAARELPVLTEYDGDLSGLDIDPLGPKPVSPTRLEAWVACPHGWFMQHVLGLQPVEQPDEQLQITPRDRGTLVHDALDLFHRRVIVGELPQPDAHGWGAVHLEALLAAFDQVAGKLEQQGATGRTAFWHSEQSRQRFELAAWLRRDSELVVSRRAHVVASEYRFGFDAVAAAELTLDDGTIVRMRGSVDRIDRCADGSFVVTDHKTGKPDSFRGITSADPTAAGTKLQLPAYAAAALAMTADAHGTTGHRPAVTAEYGFFGKGKYARVAATIDDNSWPQVTTALQHIIGGIRSGVFVARPEKSQFRVGYVKCEYCDPDHLGTAQRWTEFERKQADPRVNALLGLADDDLESGEVADV